MCTEGVAFEKINEYYNSDFNRVGREYSITNQLGEKLKKEDCTFPYDSGFEVQINIKSYLEKINYSDQE